MCIRDSYHVVFNGFDDNGTIQRFDNNDLMTQVFTIGLRKISDEPVSYTHLTLPTSDLV